MNLIDFKKNIHILNSKESDIVRNMYIQKFVNTHTESYSKQIKTKRKFSDGYCYTGYLWDHLYEAEMIDENSIYSYKNNLKMIYVFWDIHSADRIWIKDYWKFGKTTVLQLQFNLLLDGLRYLPEDIYICDRTFEWSLIMTHEDIENRRYCLKCGQIEYNV